VTRLLVGIVLGMLALAMSNWALAGRSQGSSAQGVSLTKRVAKLERTMRLQLRINRSTKSQLSSFNARLGDLGISTRIVTASSTTAGNSSSAATASCDSDEVVVGGGAGFVGTRYVSDQIMYSTPNANAWSAGGSGPAGIRTFEVYAVCARL
jgi:hypothetical protein